MWFITTTCSILQWKIVNKRAKYAQAAKFQSVHACGNLLHQKLQYSLVCSKMIHTTFNQRFIKLNTRLVLYLFQYEYVEIIEKIKTKDYCCLHIFITPKESSIYSLLWRAMPRQITLVKKALTYLDNRNGIVCDKIGKSEDDRFSLSGKLLNGDGSVHLAYFFPAVCLHLLTFFRVYS